jgi:hypothetical protein
MLLNGRSPASGTFVHAVLQIDLTTLSILPARIEAAYSQRPSGRQSLLDLLIRTSQRVGSYLYSYCFLAEGHRPK